MAYVHALLSSALSQYATCDNATGTDKTTSHAYGPLYDALFASPVRERVRRVLELGVYSGASVLAFADYFEDADVVGLDVDLARVVFGRRHPRVTYATADVTDASELTSALGGGQFDVVIDDASHRPDDQIRSLELLAPRLAPGGIYVIEDVDGGSVEAFRPKVAAVADAHGLTVEWHDLRHVTGQFDDIVVVLRAASFVQGV
jgi:predicted O-methyltransferase YrrM